MASGACSRTDNPAHEVKTSTLVRKDRSASPVHNIWKLYILIYYEPTHQWFQAVHRIF